MKTQRPAATLLATVCLLILAACSSNRQPGENTPVPLQPSDGQLSTPVPGVEPLAVQILNLPDDLRELNPSDPLILQFSEPVSQIDTGPALTLFPMVDGSESWNTTGDTLTFTSAAGFAPGQLYAAYLDAGLRGPQGEAVGSARLDFTVLSAPEVVRHEPGPAQLHTRLPEIHIDFDRSMDRESVTQALVVSPEIGYDLRWTSSSQRLILSPRQPLDVGQRYRFTIGAQATDASGIPMGEDYNWAYWMEGLQVEARLASLGSQLNPMELEFNYPVSPTSLREAFAIQPATPGEFEFASGQTVMRFYPEQRLSPSTEYEIRFTSPLRDLEGYPYPEVASQTVISPPPILSTWPEGVGLEEDIRHIEIVFDRAMDPDRSQAAFSVTPHVEGQFSWEGNTLTYQLEEVLEYRKNYTVSIGSGATDSDGDPVFRVPYSWSFSHRHYNFGTIATFGQFGSNVQVVNADGRRAIEFGPPCCEPARVTFELHKLSTHQFAALARLDPSFRSPRLADVPGETELVQSWEVLAGLSATEGSIEQMLIPDDVRSGLYLLRLRYLGRVEAEMAVALTSHTLAVKQAGRQLLTWATDINGESTPDVEVRIFTTDGRLVREGLTDSDGIFDTTLAPSDQPLIVFGRTRAGGSAVAALDRTWGLGPGYQRWWAPIGPAPVEEYLAYIYTDRPIYRPGQAVFFKAIVREDLDARYRLLPEDTEVQVQIRDARDNLVDTQSLTLNEYSSLHGQFDLGEKANLGTYTVELDLDGEIHRGSFKVQDYQKPDIQVEITSERTNYVEGDRIPIQVKAEYFFGEPVPEAQVSIQQYSLGEFYGYWWETATDDREVEYVWYPSYIEQVRGTTDSAGEFSATIEASLGDNVDDWSRWRSGLRSSTWGIEVTVDDGSRQTVSDFVVVKVFNSDEQLWLDTGGYFRKPGSSVQVRFGATDLEDEPVVDRALLLDVRRWDSDTRGYDDLIASKSVGTGTDGSASISLQNLSTGHYRLSLKNFETRGEPTTITRWIYVHELGARWSRRGVDQELLSISADRDEYAPYQRANLIIESIVGGPALLTFERSSVLRQQVIELTPPITSVEVPIVAGDAPNVFATVSAWDPLSTVLVDEYQFSNLPASRLVSASTELQVETTGRELLVSIESDKQAYRPGEEAQLTLSVSGADGQPAEAEVSLALVDEAIFALSEDLSGSMLEAFYGRRNNSVRTYSSMAPYREIYPPGRGGGGGGGGFGPGNPRSDFEDLAAWFPDLRTDENGELVVNIDLPHNLTSWRIVARAVTRETRVGESTLSVTTRQPLVVRPILPRNLTAGDTVTLSALIHNFTDSELDIEVALQATGLRVEAEKTQSVTVGSGELFVVGWPVTASDEGDVQVTLTARAGPHSDSVQLPLVVQPLAVPDLYTQVGSFGGEWTTQLILPSDASPMSTVTLEIDRSISGTVLSGLEYLTGFPYGCVEQIMSKALPNAVVGRAAEHLGYESPGDLDQKINQGLQMLYAMQHSDGGWGWWYDDASNDYQTAWVLFGLAVTQDAGYRVDAKSIKRAAEWLSEHLKEMDPRTRAFSLYSLALAGHPEREASIALSLRAVGLDPFSQSALALALREMGEDKLAREIAAELEASAVLVGDQAYWPSMHEDGHYYHKTMASTTRNTALALDALVKIHPEYEGIEGAVRWLVAHRRPRGWGTTNETSFAILALTDFIVAREVAEGAVGYVLELNGVEYAQGRLEAGAGNARFVIPAENLDVGLNELSVRTEGSRTLYYSLASRMVRPQPRLDPAGTVSVGRSYFNANSGTPINRAAAGQLVEVLLEIKMPVDGFYVLIEDKLPGGLEALNESLNSESHEVDELGEGLYHWQDLGYNYKEVRADRVSFFVTELVGGDHSFSYLARATHEGEFAALPAEVSAMYNLSLWGRSGSSVLEVFEDSAELVLAGSTS